MNGENLDDSFGALEDVSAGHFESHIPAASGYFDRGMLDKKKNMDNLGNSKMGRMTTPVGATTANPQRNNVPDSNKDHQQHDEPQRKPVLDAKQREQ